MAWPKYLLAGALNPGRGGGRVCLVILAPPRHSGTAHREGGGVKMEGGWPRLAPRVSSKQARNIFGSNRKEPKLNLFRLCFGLLHETKKITFSVCFGVSNMYRNNRNKHISFETNRNKPKNFLQPNTCSFSVVCTLADRHVQVRHKALVDRHAQVQQRFL